MSDDIQFKCPRCGTDLTGEGEYSDLTGRMTIKVQAVPCGCYWERVFPTQLYLAAGKAYMESLVDRGVDSSTIHPAPLQQ